MKLILSFFLFIVLAITIKGVFADPPEPPAGKHWEPVDSLTDEFNGTAIDANKWYDYHPNWSGRVPSQFKKGNAFVENGNLLLRNGSRINNMNEVNDPYNDVWIDAAAVVSKEKNSQPGWYYETSMKASDCAMSSSFWFRVGSYSEIDVIEHIGRATKLGVDKSYEYSCNTHVYGNQSGPSVGKTFIMSTRGRDEFHVYGFWWKSGTNLLYYHNDVEVMQVTPSVPFNEKLHMIWDTEALIPTWVGLPTIESLKDNAKNTMYVDWVRTWKLEDGTPIVNNQKPLHALGGLSGDVTVEVCDIRGRVIKTMRINSPENIETVTKELRARRSGLSAGLYLFRFITDNRVVINKKVKLF